MESSPDRPINPRSDSDRLVRVPFNRILDDHFYYTNFTMEGYPTTGWLLVHTSSKYDTIVYFTVTHTLIENVWRAEKPPDYTSMESGFINTDSPLPAQAGSFMYHFYAPRELSPKPAPRGVNQRKTRRDNSRRRRNNSRHRRNSHRNH